MPFLFYHIFAVPILRLIDNVFLQVFRQLESFSLHLFLTLLFQILRLFLLSDFVLESEVLTRLAFFLLPFLSLGGKGFKDCGCGFLMDYIELVKGTEIYKNCKNIVVGKGNEDADIMFVGEAPGRMEDEQGIPFVGVAGKNLDDLLSKVGLSLNDVYIANILKCRPPENRSPLPEEIKAHTPWLLKQIEEIKPKVVCSLGNYATKFFLAGGDVDKMNEQPGITSVHGKVRMVKINGLKFKLIPLFHPAAIIYKRELISDWEKDMEIVKEELKQGTLF